MRNGQAVEAQLSDPAGRRRATMPDWKSPIAYDPAAANALLDRFGYKRGADGWRTLARRQAAGGAVRVAARHAGPAAGGAGQEVDTTRSACGWSASKDKFPELLKLEKQCKLLSRNAAWIADYPDGDNFMQLFYGPNAYPEQQRLRSDPRVRRALRAVASAMPAGPAARQALSGDDANTRGTTRRIDSPSAAIATS